MVFKYRRQILDLASELVSCRSYSVPVSDLNHMATQWTSAWAQNYFKFLRLFELYSFILIWASGQKKKKKKKKGGLIHMQIVKHRWSICTSCTCKMLAKRKPQGKKLKILDQGLAKYTSLNVQISIDINPIALRMAKTPLSFGHSECNRAKQVYYACYACLLQ